MAVGDYESDYLHFLKNRPDPPTINGRPIEYPPYNYRPYPAAIYGPWTDERKRSELLQIARLQSLDLLKPLEREKAESLIPTWDSRLVQTYEEHCDWLARGWADGPNLVKAAQMQYLDRIAEDAAHRAYDDRRMSEAAKQEFHAADVANGEHLLDLPAPVKKPRGRPKKATSTAA